MISAFPWLGRLAASSSQRASRARVSCLPRGPPTLLLRPRPQGQDGNAFAVIGAVQRALRKAGVHQDEINQYLKDAMSGDYDNMLRTTMDWVEVA
jgi:hypothetical protein